ncbi:hypothetical protein KBD45_03805 [Candidatus Dojkabacteria bacterium]|nr:hypothetical protein [Candidatus Dojkabacteria bacterium]
MDRKCILTIVFTVFITAGLTYLYSKQLPLPDKSSQYENKTYSSKELGIKFDYPSNLSLSFEPVIPDDGKSFKIVGVKIDNLLHLRNKESMDKYMKLNLEGHIPEESTTDYNLNEVSSNGKNISFAKYKYGDGQPAGDCLWSDNWISYIGELENDLFAEIEVQEQTSCDSEKEYVNKVDPKRVEQAIEILKTVKNI